MSDQKPAAPEVKPPAADTPGQGAAAPAVDPAAARAARLAAIEGEIVQADRDIQEVTARLARLRKERDDLSRQGLGPVVTQAEALKRMVDSDQRQRMARAETAALVTGIVGGKMPTVRTPAEVAAMAKKKPVQLAQPRPPQ